MQVNRNNSIHGGWDFNGYAHGKDDGRWDAGGKAHFDLEVNNGHHFYADANAGWKGDHRGERHGEWGGDFGYKHTF